MKRPVIVSLFVFFLFSVTLSASGGERTELMKQLKTYFSDNTQEVLKAETPAEKREILNETLTDYAEVLAKVSESPLIPDEDRDKLLDMKENLTAKFNRLNGLEGNKKVPDGQLNNFAQYLQQDIEQADTMVTISLTTLLLIIILVILLV